MKKNYFLKKILLAGLIIVSLTTAVHKVGCKESQPIISVKPLSTEEDLVNIAWRDIQERLESKDGRPYRVSWVCRMTSDNIPISTSTKVHFVDYRKKPIKKTHIFKQNFLDVLVEKRVVTVIYKKSDKKHLALKEKKSKKKKSKEKIVDIPTINSITNSNTSYVTSSVTNFA